MAAALFDLDGVLINTEPSYGIFWSQMGNKYNVGIPDFANTIKGTTLTQILSRYFPNPMYQAQVISQLDAYEAQMEYPLFPNVREFLQSLKDAGIPMAIVTSSNNDKMNNLWRQHPDIRQYFDVVVTDEDVTKSKPDPQPYLIAASRLGVAPENTVVFEDSFNGLLSGRRAGAMVVALDTTNPRYELLDKADIVISSLSDITPDYIRKVLDAHN